MGTKMHIIYAVTTCSQKVYADLFSHVRLKPAAPAHKYHRILIEGLAANARVDVVANPPVHKGIMEKDWIKLPREGSGNLVYHHLPAIRRGGADAKTAAGIWCVTAAESGTGPNGRGGGAGAV